MNGESVICKSYAQVVQMIQKSGPVLHMVVMPKEQDVLQQVTTDAISRALVLHRNQRCDIVLLMNSSQLTVLLGFVSSCHVVFC